MKLPCPPQSNIALVEILSVESGARNSTSMYARGAYSGTAEVRGSNQLVEEKTELTVTGEGEMGEIPLEGGRGHLSAWSFSEGEDKEEEGRPLTS